MVRYHGGCCRNCKHVTVREEPEGTNIAIIDVYYECTFTEQVSIVGEGECSGFIESDAAAEERIEEKGW